MIDVAVIGAGAAGLMCAMTAGRRGRSVRVLERAERIGNKILISGGGRCNFTNLQAGPENYLSANPDFCKSALARYRPENFIGLVEEHGIAYHEKKLGQLFCDHSSRDIVEMLRKECAEAGVKIQHWREDRGGAAGGRWEFCAGDFVGPDGGAECGGGDGRRFRCRSWGRLVLRMNWRGNLG